MANYTFNSLKAEYAHMWASMEIKSHRLAVANSQADKVIHGKDIYLNIQTKTGVPWYVIGLMHLRESNCDFNTHLHNGDPLTARTVHVPKGWPRAGKAPFTFEYSAIDALTMPGKELHKIKDWSIERIAYTFEQFNGFGYRSHGVSSPYLWASSNQYISGKYIFDGPKGWRPNVVDQQLGALVVLKCVLDKTDAVTAQPTTSVPVVITDEKPNTPTADLPRPTTKEMNKVSRKHWWNDVLKWLGIGGASTTSMYKAAQSLELGATSEALQNIGTIAVTIGGFGLIAICLCVIVYAIYQSKLMRDDVVEGRAEPSGAGTDVT
jgi:lysozyme family protein